jgi:hypothetical protein
VAADFVTTDSGTGIVHIAPAFGEVDYTVLVAEQARFAAGAGPTLRNAVAPDGTFTDAFGMGSGRFVKDCDRDITRDLRARGLLVHQVEIDGADREPRVAACRVLAPTEWNLHPAGVVAQTIDALYTTEPVAAVERRVRLLMAAFDPCVPLDVTHTLPAGQEVQHA